MGTAPSLTITNAQTNNTGYYVAIAKNGTGWSPSRMAFLSVVWSNGIVPRYNDTNTNLTRAQARYPYICSYGGQAITNGSAHVFAGPTLDQMQPVGLPRPVNNGYYGPTNAVALVPTVSPGQLVYYRVDISYPAPCLTSGMYTQISTTIKLTAGGGGLPTPAPTSLQFPNDIDWPYPNYSAFYALYPEWVEGQQRSLTNVTGTWGGVSYQWRKDGQSIGGAGYQSTGNGGFGEAQMVLSFSKLQPEDAGVYELDVGRLSPWIQVAVQTTNVQSVLKAPRLVGGKLVCDLEGAITRNYTILRSVNLADWTNLLTLSNATGTVTFTDTNNTGGTSFYRSVLAP